MGKILRGESEANVSDSFLKDTRANAQGRIIGLIWRKGLGMSRAAISGNGRRTCEPGFNYKGCEQSRSEMERWTGTPKGTWNVPRMFRETHAISAIASSTKNRMWVFAVRNRPLDQTNASIVKDDVRMVLEVDAISAKPNSTTECEAERQKQRIFSQCKNILLRSLSFAQFIRLSWITSDEKKVNKPLRLSHVTPHWMH